MRTVLKVWLWFVSFVNLVIQYCMNLVNIYFWRELKLCWRSFKRYQLLVQCCHGNQTDLDASIPNTHLFCVFFICSVFHSGWGQEIYPFYKQLIEFWVFVYCSFRWIYSFLFFYFIFCCSVPLLSWYWRRKKKLGRILFMWNSWYDDDDGD